MEAYTGFAEVYDLFMDQTPYKEWCDYLSQKLREHGISDGLILELGCGTGSLSELLVDRGYDVIGVDNSEDMLQIAMDKKNKSGKDILYICQDMRSFELYGTVRAVVSVCDSLNYLTEPDDVTDTFRLVNNYLDPEGIFVFDFNTVYKYEEVIGNTTIAENREECSFIWENYYYPEEYINEYDITFFVKEAGERYRKFTENHYQRGYTFDEMKTMLLQAGMKFLYAVDADDYGEVKDNSERIYIVASECGKSEK